MFGPCRGRGGYGQGVAARSAGGHLGRPNAHLLGLLDRSQRGGGVSGSNGYANGALAHNGNPLGGVE